MQIFSLQLIEWAYERVYRRRKEYSANSDIWDLRLNWESKRIEILSQIIKGTINLMLLKRLL